jgi:hypothetical protein
MLKFSPHTTLEDLVAARKELQGDEKWIEQGILHPLETEEKLEEAARNFAEMLNILTQSKHDASKEEAREQQIEESILEYTRKEIEIAKTIREHILNHARTELYDADLNYVIEEFIRDTEFKGTLLDKILEILRHKDVERYDLLVSLVKKLLVHLRDTRYHALQAEKLMKNKEEIIQQRIRELERQLRR